jgi:glycerate 2-kinase
MNHQPVVVIAPDAFKGSCEAAHVAEAIARGVRGATGGAVELRVRPLADGGEGSLVVMAPAMGLDLIEIATSDALGRPCRGRIGVSARSRRAVVEAAQANGLPRVSDVPPRALDAHTYGVGTLLAAAIERGAEELILAIGGSASSDGGVGCLSALGARFLDREGREVARGARGLLDIARIDLDGLDPRWAGVPVRIAADVENPLLGPDGTAAVFSPQKGAAASDVALIEAGLARLAEVIARSTGVDVRSLPGAGAAGGTPAALVGLLGATIEPGSRLVAETVGLDALMEGADLVITGEGSFDTQSLKGKVVSAVARVAAGRCPVVVLAGRVDVPEEVARQAGISAMFSIARGPSDLDRMITDVELLLEQAAHNLTAVAVHRRSADQ